MSNTQTAKTWFGLMTLALLAIAGPSWADGDATKDEAERQSLAAQIVKAWEANQTRTPDAKWRHDIQNRIATQYSVVDLQSVPAGSLQPSGAPVTNRLGDSQADLVYTPVPPCRIVDTRAGGGILAASSSRNFWVTGTGFAGQGGTSGSCGVPFGPATAVMINFVATSSAGPGNLQAWAYGSSVPTASTLNYGSVAGLLSIANGIAIPICDPAVATCTRDFTVKANNSNTHVVADVVGYFSKSASNVIVKNGTLSSDFSTTYVDCITDAYQPAVDERITASSVSSIVGSLTGTAIYPTNVYSTDDGANWSSMNLETQFMRITTLGGYWVSAPNVSYLNLTAGTSYRFGIRYTRDTGSSNISDGRCEILVTPR